MSRRLLSSNQQQPHYGTTPTTLYSMLPPPTFLFFLLLASTAAAAPMVTYDQNLALLFNGLSFGDMQPETTTSGRGTFHLSMYDIPRDRDGSGYAKLVVSIAPLCLAANKAGVSEVTLSDLGNVLLGLTTGVAYRVVLGPVASSPSSKQLLTSLNDQGVEGFDSADDWPARVKANSNIVWLSSDAALSDYIASHTGTMGPQGAMLTTAASVECLRVRMISSSGDSVAYYSGASDATTQAATVLPEDAHVYTQGMTYPLMGGLMVTAPVNTTCAAMQSLRQLLLYFFTNTTAEGSLLARRLFPTDIEVQFESIVLVGELISSACENEALAFRAVGELSAYDAVAFFSLDGLSNGVLPYFTDHDGIPDPVELLQTVGNTSTIAFIDSPTADMITAADNAVLVAPLFAVAMAAAYTVAGVKYLSASPCTMLGLLNGSIAYWDDSSMLLDNVGIGIPHVKVVRMMSSSSTLPSLIRGLNMLSQICYPGLTTEPYDVAGKWPFDVDLEVDYADTHVILPNTNGALCLLPVPMGNRYGIRMLDFAVSKGVNTAPNDASVNVVLAATEIDDKTNAVVMPSKGNALYPFVAAVHVVVRAAYSGQCDQVSSALTFIDKMMSSDGMALINVNGYTLLPQAWRAIAPQVIRRVTCNGAYVFPVAASTLSVSATIGIGIASVAAVLLIISALIMLRLGGGRSHQNAPKDETQPFAMVFTDIQSSTALWAEAPEEMAPALDQHHAVMRAAIAATGGYEVKTIGDSFMVAFKTAHAAVSFGVLVQKMLHESPWSPVFDDFYRQEAKERADGDASVAAQYNTAAGSNMWHGLRVRIGVHYGIGQIKLDPVTQAYDYYGTVVNTAARVEAVGHGGQVCVTSAALEAAKAAEPMDSVVVTDLGPQELRGLNEPLHLFQVAPRELSARVFAALRLDKVVDEEESVFSFEPDTPSGAGAGGSRSHTSSSHEQNRSTPPQDDVTLYFHTLASKSKRFTADELLAHYRFFKTLLSNFKKGRNAAAPETAIVKQCCEQWRISRDPESGLEQRVAKRSGTENLQLCKLIVRVTLASSAAKQSPQSSTMQWDSSMEMIPMRPHSPTSPSAAKYSVNGDSIRLEASDRDQHLPGQQQPTDLFESSLRRPAD